VKLANASPKGVAAAGVIKRKGKLPAKLSFEDESIEQEHHNGSRYHTDEHDSHNLYSCRFSFLLVSCI